MVKPVGCALGRDFLTGGPERGSHRRRVAEASVAWKGTKDPDATPLDEEGGEREEAGQKGRGEEEKRGERDGTVEVS